MDRIRTSGEAPAVLAGSLSAFPLLDVLALLATTRHVGELKVVSEGADEHFWVDAGDLIDTTGGATGRLFDLARADEAWFTVTATTGTPKAGARMALTTVIEHLAPRLAEWQVLRTIVPLDAMARMAPSTSRPEVHVRADQWRVLSRLGGGRPVGEVLEGSDATPVETLRILRELVEAGLVTVEAQVQAPDDHHEEHEGGTATRPATSGPAPSKPAPEPSGARRAARAAAGGPSAPADGQARPSRSEPAPPAVLMPSPLLTRRWAAPPR